MKYEIQEFKHDNFAPVRVITNGEDVWFSIGDMQRNGIKDPYTIVYTEYLKNEEKYSYDLIENATSPYFKVMSEHGVLLWLMVFNETNRNFISWVTNTIIPVSTGYTKQSHNNVDVTEEAIVNNPLLLSKVFSHLVDKIYNHKSAQDIYTDRMQNNTSIANSGNDNITYISSDSSSTGITCISDNTQKIREELVSNEYITVKDIDWLDSFFDTSNTKLPSAISHNLMPFCKQHGYNIKHIYINRKVCCNYYTKEAIEVYKKYLLDNPGVLYKYRRPLTTSTNVITNAA